MQKGDKRARAWERGSSVVLEGPTTRGMSCVGGWRGTETRMCVLGNKEGEEEVL